MRDGVLTLLPGEAHHLGAELAGEVHQTLLDVADLHAEPVQLGLAGVDDTQEERDLLAQVVGFDGGAGKVGQVLAQLRHVGSRSLQRSEMLVHYGEEAGRFGEGEQAIHGLLLSLGWYSPGRTILCAYLYET